MTITAAEIMTSPAATVLPQASVAQIAALLSSKKISAVPVCQPDGTLVGIVSEGDILRPFRESARLKRDWWLELIAAGETLSQQFLDYVRRDTATAADVMVRNVITVEPQATLPVIAELMVRHSIKRVPVMQHGRVIGIVSRADLVGALARAPAMIT